MRMIIDRSRSPGVFLLRKYLPDRVAVEIGRASLCRTLFEPELSALCVLNAVELLKIEVHSSVPEVCLWYTHPRFDDAAWKMCLRPDDVQFNLLDAHMGDRDELERLRA